MIEREPRGRPKLLRTLAAVLARTVLRLRRRRSPPVLEAALSRRRRGDLVALRFRLAVAPSHHARVCRALAAAIARTAAHGGGAVGCVRVVAGEEPVVYVVAPRVDLVAESVMRALSASPGQHLWVRLRAGSYLAEALDPLAPLAGDDAEIAALVAGSAVRHVLAARVGRRERQFLVDLELHGRVEEVRAVLAAGRPFIAAARDEVAASSSAPAAPKRSVNRRL